MVEKSELSDYLQFGIDMQARRIYFGVPIDGATENHADFTQASVDIAVRAMHRMANQSNMPIDIYMDSYGGNPYSMLYLVDEILACPCQVRFFGGGAIMSAATWVMCVCDERNLYPNCTVMVHDGSDWVAGKHTDVQIESAEMKRLQDKLYDIYVTNTRMSLEFWQDVCARDLYLTAEEAVMLGLADKVLEPKKRGNLRKTRQASLKKNVDEKIYTRLVKDLYRRVQLPQARYVNIIKPKPEPCDPQIKVPVQNEVVPQAQQQEATAPEAQPIATEKKV